MTQLLLQVIVYSVTCNQYFAGLNAVGNRLEVHIGAVVVDGGDDVAAIVVVNGGDDIAVGDDVAVIVVVNGGDDIAVGDDVAVVVVLTGPLVGFGLLFKSAYFTPKTMAHAIAAGSKRVIITPRMIQMIIVKLLGRFDE